MKHNYTHLTLVVDRSGSMASVRSDAEGGVRSLLEQQFAEPGELSVTLVEFDDQIEPVRRMSREPFEYSLEPRGMTALFDAVGREIVATGHDLSQLPEDERPGKVVFVIVTDGDENASQEYTLEKVREMIHHQAWTFQWTFRFIGAGESSWQGQQLGVGTTQYAGDGVSTRAAYSAMSASLSAFRGGADFSMPDRIDGDAGFDAGTAPVKKATRAKKAAPAKPAAPVKPAKPAKKAAPPAE